MNTETIYDLTERAEQLCDTGNLQAALDLYTRILSLDANNYEATLMAGSICGELGHLDEAERLLRRAADSKPDDTAAYLTLAHVLRARGNSLDAIQTLESSLRNCPDDPEVHCALGVMLNETGRIADAILHFEQASRMDKQNEQIRTTLQALQILYADTLEKGGDHEQAFETIRSLLESEDPPLDAVLIFAKLSVIFETRDECRYLLNRIREHKQLNNDEQTSVVQALAWLDQA